MTSGNSPMRSCGRCASEGRKALDRLRTRKRYARQLAAEGGSSSIAGGIFDDNALTLGFARRFATYKRPNLLLHDPERLVRLLSDPQRPVQLILAGKAHPQDLPGQALIQQWNDFIKRPEVSGRVVFLSDYDMLLAQELGAGSRSVDQHAAAPLGGLRDEWNESSRQWRSESFRAGRLVG